MVGFLAGLLSGAIQFFFTILVIRKINTNDTLSVLAIAMGKAVLWIGLFALLVLLSKQAILPFGVGISAALVLGGFGGFVLQLRKKA